jgi:hypothetical protein
LVIPGLALSLLAVFLLRAGRSMAKEFGVMLAKEPDDRVQTAEELATALTTFCQDPIKQVMLAKEPDDRVQTADGVLRRMPFATPVCGPVATRRSGG